MRPRKRKSTQEERDRVVAEARRLQEERMGGYREKALALFPHICGRCGREFSGSNLRDLTVHHKDHNHDNNPPDGSNWELLCVSCHEDEHLQQREGGHLGKYTSQDQPDRPLSSNPFAGLKDLIQPDDNES